MFKVGDKVKIKILSSRSEYKSNIKYPDNPGFTDEMFNIACQGKIQTIKSQFSIGKDIFVLKNIVYFVWDARWLEKVSAQLELFD
jgi:hypothetical protein